MGAVKTGSIVVLGNGPDAERVAQLYRDSQPSRRVILGLTETSAKEAEQDIEHFHISWEDDEEWLNFQKFIQDQLPIDQLVLVFTPAMEGANGSSDNKDPTDEVLIPLMKCVKTALYQWRRSDVSQKRLAFITRTASENEDRLVQISNNAVLGMFRSLRPKMAAVGVSPELIFTELSDKANYGAHKTKGDGHNNGTDVVIEALVSILKGKGLSNKEPVVHLIENGQITSQSPSVGECRSQSIEILHKRIATVISLSEGLLKFSLKYRPWYSTNTSKSTSTPTQLLFALLLKNALGFASYYFAMRAFENGNNALSFVLAIVVARVGVLPGVALFAQVLSKTFLNQYITASLLRDIYNNPRTLIGA